MNENIIEAENLSFSYDSYEDGAEEKQVLHNVTFSVARGSFVCILGHNGSGKSTLAKLFAQINDRYSGIIRLCGKTLSDLDEDGKYEIRRRVGMVFQNPDNQIVTSVVEDDVAFGPENLGIPPKEIRERVDEALKKVGMTEYRSHSTAMLSGGQKQRIAIAGILAMRPEVVIFDEVTAMLDPIGRRDIMNVIEELHRSGVTVLHITHYMEEATLCDRVIVLNDGEIAADGTPREVFSDTDVLHAAGLDVPPAAELSALLRKDGIVLPCGIITEQEAVDAIADILVSVK